MACRFAVLSLVALGLAAVAPSAQTGRAALPVGAPRGVAVDPGVGAAPAVVLPRDVPARTGGYSESFDDVAGLADAGWALRNNSSPVGLASWFQGNADAPDSFPAHEGAPDAYVAVNYNSTNGRGEIWNWLLTPELTLTNGTEMTFWTRTTVGSPYADRLQVRLSTSGASVDVGAQSGEVGDFETLLDTINPSLAAGGYPDTWTAYTVTVADLPEPTTGRFAFLYAVTDGGLAGSNSNYIGIDEVSIAGGAVGSAHDPVAGGVRLSASTPNPVASLATLSVTLDAPTALTLTVVDALGRTVATLASGALGTGTHQIRWDARAAAPGVYVARLVAGTGVQVQRVVVAR